MGIVSSVVRAARKAVSNKPKAKASKTKTTTKPSNLAALTKGQSAKDLATLSPKILRELMAKAKKAEKDALTAAQSDVARKLQARLKKALDKSPAYQKMFKESIESETDPRLNTGGSIAKGKK
jgi:hypothetical protein